MQVGLWRGEESVKWLRRKQKPGQIGVGFHAAGATLVWLQPAPNSGNPSLVACDTLRGSNTAQLAGPLQDWVEQHHARGARCAAVMEAGSYQLLQVEPPQVPAEELRTALKWRIRDLIGFAPEHAVIDLFEPPQSVRGRVRNINVVVAHQQLLRERIDLLETSGFALDAIDIGQLAQRNIAACLPHNEPGVALLSLDADSGLITLVRNGEIYLARELDFGLDALPQGSGDVTDDPVYERIMLELQRSLDYYESALSQAPLNRIVLYPGGDRCAGLLAYLKQNFFQQQVHELGLDDLCESGREDTEELALLPASLHAFGAALREPEAVS